MKVRGPFHNVADFLEALEADTEKLYERLGDAIDETVEESVGIIWTRVPFAFGELHGSIHVEGRSVVADAPHAAPVETGSMPHTPPLEPLIAWCELRGMDNPRAAAWAIQQKIAQEGTQPHWYMRGSLPQIRQMLDRQMRKALKPD